MLSDSQKLGTMLCLGCDALAAMLQRELAVGTKDEWTCGRRLWNFCDAIYIVSTIQRRLSFVMVRG